MRLIGGELESKDLLESIYFTDSGRSSLKLFLRNQEYKNKKILIPNYYCEVIEEVLVQETIDYEFYNILEDLSIDIDDINVKNFDIFYVINYFGVIQDLKSLDLSTKILLEDNVFFENFTNHTDAKQWFAFNSFRKISELADGSLIKTNIPIDNTLILQNEASFSKIKYEAKNIKYKFISENKFSEEEYLEKFDLAESTLNHQVTINKMSNISIYKLQLLDKSTQKMLKKRYDKLLSLFGQYTINNRPTYYSFFILKIKNRDIVRKELMKKGIFLPIHWPKSTQENKLYKELISVPLFLVYNDIEFEYLVNAIKEIL